MASGLGESFSKCWLVRFQTTRLAWLGMTPLGRFEELPQNNETAKNIKVAIIARTNKIKRLRKFSSLPVLFAF